MQQYQLEIRGVRTPCYDSAESGADAVLFVHGNPGTGDDWLDLMARVSPFVRCLAPTCPASAAPRSQKTLTTPSPVTPPTSKRCWRPAVLSVCIWCYTILAAPGVWPGPLRTLNVMWGKCDPYVSWRLAEQQRETFPRAEIVYFEDSGHWPFIDNPEGVAAVLVPFLRRVTTGGGVDAGVF